MKTQAGHGETGEVCSVGEDVGSDGEHVRVTVKHGKRKKVKKAKGFDDRRETSFTVPRAKAHHYPVGAKVQVALRPHVPKKKEKSDDESFDDLYGGKGV